MKKLLIAILVVFFAASVFAGGVMFSSGGVESVSGSGFVGNSIAGSDTIVLSDYVADGIWIEETASSSGTVSYMHCYEAAADWTSSAYYRMVLYHWNGSAWSKIAQTGLFAEYSGGAGSVQRDIALESSTTVTASDDYRLVIVSGNDSFYTVGATTTGGPTSYHTDFISPPDGDPPSSVSDDGDVDATKAMRIWADNSSS